MIKPLTFSEVFTAAEPHLIGLWKYREYGKPTKWSATYLMDDGYWDVGLQLTAYDALRQVSINLEVHKAKVRAGKGALIGTRHA